MITPENRRCNLKKDTLKQTGRPEPSGLNGLTPLRHLLLYVSLSALAFSPLSEAEDTKKDLLTTLQLKQQCRPLMEGGHSLMSAFQSGQCSSYILGIYDLLAQQCPNLSIRRDEAVAKTLSHLSTLADNPTTGHAPAVKTLGSILSTSTPCLPIASL